LSTRTDRFPGQKEKGNGKEDIAKGREEKGTGKFGLPVPSGKD